MARGLNKLLLIGNVGSIESRSNNNNLFVNVSLATSREWTDKATGEKKSKVQWHKVEFFGKLAEIVKAYVAKGDKLYVEGPIESRVYTDKSGIERSVWSVHATDVQFLTPKGETRQTSQPTDSGNEWKDFSGDDEPPF